VNGVEAFAADARARVDDLRREVAVLRVQSAERHGQGARRLLREGREARRARRRNAIDLEARLGGGVHGYAAEIAVAAMPRAHVDRVRARVGVHADEGTANAQVLLLDGLDFGDDVGPCRDERRGLSRVDVV